jgi:hypothetical protein
MKKLKSICLASFLGLTLSNSAFAIFITGENTGTFANTNVGDADTFKAWSELANSGSNTELNFINQYANPTNYLAYYKNK